MLTSDLSDTVAPTLVFAIYQLALNPDKAEKLYQEVKDVSIKDLATFKKLPYLNAVIMETLRLHPAVPTGGNRDTPPEGMMIDGTFIPGNTTIVAPRYVLGRCKFLIIAVWSHCMHDGVADNRRRFSGELFCSTK